MNKNKWLLAAKAAGMEAFEIYESKNAKTSIRLYEGNVDGFTVSACNGIALRGIYQGKMGICFLENDSDDMMEYAISQIKANASLITSDDEVEIYHGEKEYPSIEISENSMLTTPNEEKIALLKKLEKALLESDPRISQVMSTNYGQSECETSIDNSYGLHLHSKTQASIVSCGVMAKDGDDTKVEFDWKYMRHIQDLDVDAFAKELSEKVCAKLHARSIASGEYPVLMEKGALSDLLEALCAIFNGESAYKGISILKNRLHEAIFSDKISIIDDPLMKDGFQSTPFDDEGVACQKKYVVKDGVLQTYLHNLKSAKLMKTRSTGNGFKAGYASGVGIAPTNFYIENGTTAYEDLIKSMEKGIIITDITGLHAGLNTVSTEFSLQSSGFYVENGKIIRPLNLITIAGNFMDMMKQVVCVGDDLKMNSSGIGTPSILFEKLAVSGK